MRGRIEISDFESFDNAFGELGLKVGPRTGPNKRTKDDKEWYIVRRFLKEVVGAGIFDLPLYVRRGNPPDEPDFVLEHENNLIHVEITEATSEADQKEMTAIEKSEQLAILLGEYGGRFHGGASQPGIAWAADVINAIERKAEKVVVKMTNYDRHLVIYPNSNASALIFDADDELDAAQFLQSSIAENKEKLIQVVRGCLVHILAKEHVFFDVLGSFVIQKRA